MSIEVKREFDLHDYLVSDTAKAKGIGEQYTPDLNVQSNIQLFHYNITTKLLDYLSEKYPNGKLIRTSGYRCPRLNKMIGGAKNSHHMIGSSGDYIFLVYNKKQNHLIIEAIKDLKLPYRQMINENNFAWIHIEYLEGENKMQDLTITK